jgi:hypothetical protein
MIGMILKEVYKENGNKKRRTTETPVKRAEPVEEDGD